MSLYEYLQQSPSYFNSKFLIFLSIWFFGLGACVGSFLNVVIWRMPRGKSVISPPSHCPRCQHKLAWYENIPVLSWCFLRGKCKGCQLPISVKYPLGELLTAFLYLLIWGKVILNDEPLFFAFNYLSVTFFLIAVFFIDKDHRIIPNKLTYTMMIFGLIFSAFFPQVTYIKGVETAWQGLLYSFVGLVAGGLFFGILAIIGELIFKKEALGWGDVKYLAAVGATLGFPGIFFTVFFGSIFGSIYGGLLILSKKGTLKTFIPFGVFLVLGTLLWILAGNYIFSEYIALMESIKIKSI
ncbi:prepilin peptidase [Lentisphaerota bacterium WC36G]|nr:prepilin peptidase [Lentisphaerae bacterium WC36]